MERELFGGAFDLDGVTFLSVGHERRLLMLGFAAPRRRGWATLIDDEFDVATGDFEGIFCGRGADFDAFFTGTGFVLTRGFKLGCLPRERFLACGIRLSTVAFECSVLDFELDNEDTLELARIRPATVVSESMCFVFGFELDDEDTLDFATPVREGFDAFERRHDEVGVSLLRLLECGTFVVDTDTTGNCCATDDKTRFVALGFDRESVGAVEFATAVGSSFGTFDGRSDANNVVLFLFREFS